MIDWQNDIAKITIPTPFPVGDVHAYIVKGEALTLIDAGPKTEESRQAIENALKDLRLTWKDLDQVLITHHHPDHCGGVDFAPAELPFIGHENNQRWLQLTQDFLDEHDSFYYSLAEEIGLPNELKPFIGKVRKTLKYSCDRTLSNYLKDGDSLLGLAGWKAIETLGHAQSHLSFFRESDGMLIGGDMLLEKISPNPLLEPPFRKGELRPRPQLQLNESLKKLANLPISEVFPGHGDNIMDVPSLIQHRLEAQHSRAMKVLGMIEETPSTAFQLCQRLFPKVYLKEIGLTLSETIAQLDYLIDLGEIKGSHTEAGLIYSVR
ncbi:MBL fold metallo-hydrolase [Peribacillus alkalitolerans]|uniref:MBL fold metallo-hydrolase n=1 Tax=Peribacillus alkalitolerans TaxID=1550385 RepID=UPI0013D30BFA|nr:MBL fold metallo-hydrolase [Peribacillus alkalitolerans]